MICRGIFLPQLKMAGLIRSALSMIPFLTVGDTLPINCRYSHLRYESSHPSSTTGLSDAGLEDGSAAVAHAEAIVN